MPAVRLCVLLSGFVLLSCHQNRLQLDSINKGLETSTLVLEANCDTSMRALIHGSRDLTDEYLAVRWRPIVAKATLMARQAADYIDSLQIELRNTHQITDARISLLFDTLRHFKQSLPGLFCVLQTESDFKWVEQNLTNEYASLAVLPGYSATAIGASACARWKDSTFDDDETLNRLALTKLKHDLMLSAYQLIQFTRKEIAYFEDMVFTRFDCVEALSANVVKPGDTIQVTAGIASFKTELEPIITIANKRINLTHDAIAVGKVKAPLKPGKYSIPVRLEYTKPDGSKAWRNDTLHYQVVAPCIL